VTNEANCSPRTSPYVLVCIISLKDTTTLFYGCVGGVYRGVCVGVYVVVCVCVWTVDSRQ
jgi:hypothetical protein